LRFVGAGKNGFAREGLRLFVFFNFGWEIYGKLLIKNGIFGCGGLGKMGCGKVIGGCKCGVIEKY